MVISTSNLVGIIDVGVDACGILSRSVGLCVVWTQLNASTLAHGSIGPIARRRVSASAARVGSWQWAVASES